MKTLELFIVPLLIVFLSAQCSKKVSNVSNLSLFSVDVSNILVEDEKISKTWTDQSTLDDSIILLSISSKRSSELSLIFANRFGLVRIPDEQMNRSKIVVSLFEKAGFLDSESSIETEAWINDRDHNVVYMIVLPEIETILLGESYQ